MTTLEASQIEPPIESGAAVPLSQVDAELARQLQAVRDDLHVRVQLVRMSNLIVYCTCEDHLERAESAVGAIVANHPARVILLLGDPDDSEKDITAKVLVRKVSERQGFVAEQVTLRASSQSVDRLAFAVRKLLIGDLPTNLWWACPTAPSLAGPILDSLAEHAQQVVYDSLGWQDPTRAVASTASWLEKFQRNANDGAWRIATDVNWRRLKPWRRFLSESLDPSTSPGFLASLREVAIDHGPDAVTQAWQIGGWLASRLGWKLESTKVEPQTEVALSFHASQGLVTLKWKRLDDGPAEIRRIKMVGGPAENPVSLEFASEGDGRLSVKSGSDEASRTVAVQPRNIADLIARQLTDREPDSAFLESMVVAQQLARRVVS
jgi:glucose-6-phosphate dehydrogenase assembly protein OpcA